MIDCFRPGRLQQMWPSPGFATMSTMDPSARVNRVESETRNQRRRFPAKYLPTDSLPPREEKRTERDREREREREKETKEKRKQKACTSDITQGTKTSQSSPTRKGSKDAPSVLNGGYCVEFCLVHVLILCFSNCIAIIAYLATSRGTKRLENVVYLSPAWRLFKVPHPPDAAGLGFPFPIASSSNSTEQKRNMSHADA
ncbi:hypothetical protein LZ31DRAFT_246240 [Colletotrichum somersetense]|nr:hypothetical protein LZ31DRAFT_246240 [Colletotrichum somersetense]